jgi:hypothetical protein
MSPGEELAVLTAEVKRHRAGREMEQTMIRNAVGKIQSLEDALGEAQRDRELARATIERVQELVRPLGILYAALPDGLYARRCKNILDDLRAALGDAS